MLAMRFIIIKKSCGLHGGLTFVPTRTPTHFPQQRHLQRPLTEEVLLTNEHPLHMRHFGGSCSLSEGKFSLGGEIAEFFASLFPTQGELGEVVRLTAERSNSNRCICVSSCCCCGCSCKTHTHTHTHLKATTLHNSN